MVLGTNTRRKRKNAMELKDVEKDVVNLKQYVGAFYERDLDNIVINLKDAYFIIYTDNPAHWIGCHIHDDCLEVMDSLGIIYFYKNFCTFIYHNTIGKSLLITPPLQHRSSLNCGKYVKYFFWAKGHGLSFYDILSNFTSDLNKNDKIVNKLIT